MYSLSTTKIADHGGGTEDDRNVALLVVDGGADHHEAHSVRTDVSTTQVAPSILSWLGLNPSSLTAVQQAHTEVLPGH